MEKQVSVSVKCPICRKSLMDEFCLMHGKPCIKVNIVTEKDRGVLRLCSIYGCYDLESNIDLPEHEIVDFYCPQCNKELTIMEECKICGAPMVSFVIKSGGRVNICSRKGCENHFVAFDSLTAELTEFYHEFGF